MKFARQFREGDRVRISDTYEWARGATGTIVMPPEFAQQLAADNGPWQGLTRWVKGRHRMIQFYFVSFDKPRWDADDDGPYAGGAIEADAIILCEKDPASE